MRAQIEAIEEARRAMKIPTTSLCLAAGITRKTYENLRGMRHEPRAYTVARLNAALDRLRKGFGAEANALAPGAAYRACLVLAALVLDEDPRAALASNPKKRATLDPRWRAAAKVRRVGIYIANQFFGFAQADLARAAGMTRGGVSAAIRELYDERDRDPALARVLSQLEEIFE